VLDLLVFDRKTNLNLVPNIVRAGGTLVVRLKQKVLIKITDVLDDILNEFGIVSTSLRTTKSS
jgi:hypothetical protein